jgi:hypothetical protein
MSANFLDKSGFCMGIDFHVYFTVVPPAPVPVPVPYDPHIVGDSHAGPSKFWRIAHTVTTNGNPTLQSQWAMLVIPHCFIPAGPSHPVEAVNIAAIIALGSITPPMAVHSVTAEKGTLLTELTGSHGLNVDCSDMPLVGVSKDTNLNSVMTSPTLGDYLGSLLGAILSIAWSWTGAAIIGDKVKGAGAVATILAQAVVSLDLAILQTLLDYLATVGDATNDAVNYIFNWITQKVQELTDSKTPLLQ